MAHEPKWKQMTTSSRQSAWNLLYSRVNDGVLEYGAMAETARLFGISANAMALFWREINKKIADNDIDAGTIATDTSFFENNRKKSGRLPKWDRTELREAVESVPFSKRKTFRCLAQELKIPKSTLHKMCSGKEGLFRRQTSTLKPMLTEQNKAARFAYAIEEVHRVAGQDGEFRFKDMMDRVDVDEKWFYISREKESYILVADNEEGNGEEDVYRSAKKLHLKMVMFLCAQARPRFDHGTNQMWDGKLGMWPIGEFVPAERSSVNRPRGHPVWKNTSVTKDVYRQLLLEKVIPSIIEKWPRTQWNNNAVIIRIQQDGATSHIDADDEEFWMGLVELGVFQKILLYKQPANSPDVNINDLGYFRALQSLYHQYCPNDEAGIIQFVNRAYTDYDPIKINDIWLTMMSCLNCIIDDNGGNDYKIPHLNKNTLRLEQALPVSLIVTGTALQHLQIPI
jgi:hypothetical protein